MKQFENVKILIVNDDLTQLTLIAGLLERQGATTLCSSGAEDALNLLRDPRKRPDLIITDIQMPGIDGWRFCSLLRSHEHEDLGSIPILAISAVFTDNDAEKVSREIGADAFCTVPIDANELYERVSALLADKQKKRSARVTIVGEPGSEKRELSQVFVEHGFEVTSACSQPEEYGADWPDILVLHLGASPERELQIVKDIRRHYMTTIILIISAGEQRDLPRRFLQAGADAFVPRPFDAEFAVMLAEKALKERAFLKAEELLRRQSEELAESRSRYELMMESITDPVYICNSDYRIEFVNPAAASMPGKAETGRICHTAIFGFDTPCPWCAMERIVAGSPVRGELTHDASRRHFQQSAAPLRHPDGRISRLAILRDTTGEREMKARIEQAEKLESMGRLVRGIAHDFNNVFGAIHGYGELIRDEIRNRDGIPGDEKLEKRIMAILTASTRAAGIVKHLLTFSRQAKYRSVEIDLHAVIEEIAILLGCSIDRGIQISQHLNAPDAQVAGDPHQIRSIIFNIAINGAEAMPEGGELTIATESLTLSAGKAKKLCSDLGSGNWIAISITDTGIGIDPDNQKRLFEPFFTTKEPGKGYGLGLSSAYGAVKDHGGAVTVASEPGKGTAVTVYLPRVKSEPSESTPKKNHENHIPILGIHEGK